MGTRRRVSRMSEICEVGSEGQLYHRRVLFLSEIAVVRGESNSLSAFDMVLVQND